MTSGNSPKVKSDDGDKKKRCYIALSDSAEFQQLARKQPAVPEHSGRRMAETIFYVFATAGGAIYLSAGKPGVLGCIAIAIFVLGFFVHLDSLKPRYNDLKRRPDAAAFATAVREGNIIEANQDIVDALTEVADAAESNIDVQRLLQDRWQIVGKLQGSILPMLRPTSGALPQVREIAQQQFREGVQAVYDGGSPQEREATNYHMALELGVEDPEGLVYGEDRKEVTDR